MAGGSNTYITPTIVAKEVMRQLKNNCVVGNLINRSHEKEWDKTSNGYKIGSAVNIKAPVYFRVQDGATVSSSTLVDLVERDTTLTIENRKHVAFKVSAQDMTLSIDKFSQRFLEPAAQALANHIDQTCLYYAYQHSPNQVGTPGTTPSAYLTFAQAAARLTEEGCPQEGRGLVVDPQCSAKISDTLKGVLHQGIVGQAVKKGYKGPLAGMELYESNNIPTHTCGSRTVSEALVDGTPADTGAATTITMDDGATGSSSNTIARGDIFTIGDGTTNTESCNPISGAATGSARQFVVCNDSGGDAYPTADTPWTASSGQWGAIQTIPGLDPWQLRSEDCSESSQLPYQNISHAILDNDQITFAGAASLSHKVSMCVHRDFMTLAMVPLEMPASVTWKAQMSHDGYSVRVLRYFDGDSDMETIRLDILYGIQVLNPFLSCRIAG
jgi:hypothetical protein